MSVHAAMEWLLNHPEADPSDSGNRSELTAEAAQPSSSSAASELSNPTDLPSTSTSDPPVGEAGNAPSTSNISVAPSSSRRQSKAQTILESFRAYKRRKFKPNSIVSG